MDRSKTCLAPKDDKKFVFPPVSSMSDADIDLEIEEIDFILKPSMVTIMRKRKQANPSLYQKLIKDERKYNESILIMKQTADLSINKINYKKRIKYESLTLHLVGLPSNFAIKLRKTTFELDEIESTKVKYPLKPTDTINKLKNCIRKTFRIPWVYDLLILYSHMVISSNNDTKLNEFGITNRSLLLVAISPEAGHLSTIHNHCTFDEEKMDCINRVKRPCIDQLDTQCIKGFDVITQESDVDVYRMPICGHVMSKESLYHYALIQFKDKNNLQLICPHTTENKEEEKYSDRWSCSHCTFINEPSDDECPMCLRPKPWSCSRCTFINKNGAQNCEMCDYTKDVIETSEKQMLCHEIWDYSLLKRILETKTAPVPVLTPSDKRQKRIDKYYVIRHKYSKLKQQKEDIPIKFQYEIRQIQKRLINETDLNEANLSEIRKKAKKDVALGRFLYPTIKRQSKRGEVTLRTAKLELLSARNNIQSKYNAQRCPKCCSLYYKDKESQPQVTSMKEMKNYYKTKCVLCVSQSFCFCCGKEWTRNHSCDSEFQSQLINILKDAETKAIGNVYGVPSIRCCPKCCQLIYHTEACKHMECRNCKTKFCFVCMKLHENGSWQCGSSSDRCAIAQRQDKKTLPNTVAINEQSFQLF